MIDKNFCLTEKIQVLKFIILKDYENEIIQTRESSSNLTYAGRIS